MNKGLSWLVSASVILSALYLLGLPLFSGYGFEAVLHTEMRGGKPDLGLRLGTGV